MLKSSSELLKPAAAVAGFAAPAEDPAEPAAPAEELVAAEVEADAFAAARRVRRGMAKERWA